jgi:hypothetical protein
MRKLLIGLFITILSTGVKAQKEPVPIQSKIEKVTVFIQGAQVERVAKQNLVAGKYNVVFAGISPKIDKQSIQLKADGKLTVLSVVHQMNFLNEQKAEDEIKQLELQKEQVIDKMNMEKNIQNVYRQEEQMILKNQVVKGDNATLKAADLKEMADFQRQRLTEIYSKLQEIDHNLKRMDADLQKLNKQLTELNQKKDLSTSEVVVAIDVKEAMQANFRLTYLVKQSSWFPTYDIRVEDISKPISLQMKANINQQSGEDWKEVKLFLSTGNPNENGTNPTLLPWYLKYYYPYATNSTLIRGVSGLFGAAGSNLIRGIVKDEQGNPVAGATVLAKGTRSGTVTDAQGNFSIQMPAGATAIVVSFVGYSSQELQGNSGYANVMLTPDEKALSEVVVTAYGSDGYSANDTYKKRKDISSSISTITSYQPTTTIFEIKEPYSVPDDGKNYTADINDFEVDAVYEYYSVPKIDASAYLTAKIIDWQDLNLLPGESNLFFEGTYLGNSFLDVMNAGDTLKLSLGKDKGVVVKRTMMKEYSQKKFLGSNRTDSREYEIVVRNNKQQPVNITIEDQFPISTNKDIEIEKTTFEGGKLDDDTKKVSWRLNVDTKKETKLQLAYSVKYPKDKLLQLE